MMMMVFSWFIAVVIMMMILNPDETLWMPNGGC
jgi:hypothetical protein